MVSSPNGFWDRQNLILNARNLTSSETLLLLVLNSYCGANNSCWPSLETLHKSSRLSVNTIKKCLRTLASEARAVISLVSGGGRTSNVYTIHADKLSQCNSAPGANLPPVNSGPAAGADLNASRCKSNPAGGSESPHELSLNNQEHSKNVQAANVDCSDKPAKAKTAKPGNQWATLTSDDIKRVVRGRDLDTFLKWDAIGLKEFGWLDSEVAQRQRLSLWSYAIRKGNNPAGILTVAFRRGWFESTDHDDEQFARDMLKLSPVVTECPLQLVPDEPDIEQTRQHNAVQLARLAK